MANSITLNANGLISSPNPLSKPQGSLDVASDIIIKRDNVIESRRGFRLYDQATSGVSKQLRTYQQRILRHIGSTLSYDTGVLDSSNRSIFSDFAGTYTEPKTGVKIKSVEAAGNFLFTSSNGVQKISAASASDLTTTSGFITQAGGVKGLDIQSRLKIQAGRQTGFFTQDSTIAYRAAWAIKDKNDNLTIGTPSQRTEIYNPLISLLLFDYERLLGALDDIGSAVTADTNVTGTLIDNNNYESLTVSSPIRVTASSTATTLYNNLLVLTTKIDTDIRYADTASTAPLQISAVAGDVTITSNVLTITFSSGTATNFFSAGSNIYLTGLTDVGAKAIVNPDYTTTGYKVVTATATTITVNLNIALTSGGAVQTYTAGNVTRSSPTITSNAYRSITRPGIPDVTTTNTQLVSLQTYLSAIIARIQAENTNVLGATLAATYTTSLAVTTSADVILDITIPDEINASYFLQLYRSTRSIATGVTVLNDLIPDDELQQVYEAYPTAAEIAAGVMTITDTVGDSFRGANLYTNPNSGEGILQANDIPPYCLDIARYKNAIFYANTKTKYRLSINLLGLSNMITDYGAGTSPKIVITDKVTTSTFKFVTGVQQVTTVTCGTGATLVAAAAPASYFLIYNAKDLTRYYVWYRCGSSTDPAVTYVDASGKTVAATGIAVNVLAGDTNTIVATKTCNAINRQLFDFSASSSTNVVTVTNVNTGYTSSPTAGTSGFTTTVTTSGRGEKLANSEIVLSSKVSPGQAVDETARSMVKIINQSTGATYAYYLSGADGTPGQIVLEERTLGNNPFYILGNNANTGAAFSPNIAPTLTISSNSLATSTVITTSAVHGLVNGDSILTVGSNSTPSIDGAYAITYISTTQFSIPVNVTVAGTTGFAIKLSSAIVGTNEVKPQRIYFSKVSQPEAVPITNYLDVGSENKAILRIFPIRDSLFVFKEDGLYRISGEQAPYNIALFDSSYLLIAPDSLDVSNNVLYGWTQQGIQTVSESDTQTISRNIDTDILRIGSSNFPNFATSTWGIGYESDNAYLVFTLTKTTDVIPSVCYRYCTLTRTWTTWNKTNTCGVVNPTDSKLYLGAGNVYNIEQERKSFSRLDYADLEILTTLSLGSYLSSGSQIRLGSIIGISKGDVLTQEQLLTIYEYNNILLKLDKDLGVNQSNFSATLLAASGDDLRKKLTDATTGLAPKLDLDSSLSGGYGSLIQSCSGSISSNSIATSTVVTTSAPHNLQTNRWITITGSNCSPTIDGTYQVTVLTASTFSIAVNVINNGTTGTYLSADNDFRDIKACYNLLVTRLNNDSGTGYKNYMLTNTTNVQEAIITAISTNTNILTLNTQLPFVVGPLTIYNSIPCTFTYSPNTFGVPEARGAGDPLGLKHIREATVMFENQAFTSATLSFATDLVPAFLDISFTGEGNGIFGMQSFGSNYFGGGGNSVPFRTYIPRNYQRCKYILVKFTHSTAREKWSILGVTLTGEVGQSTRAYR